MRLLFLLAVLLATTTTGASSTPAPPSHDHAHAHAHAHARPALVATPPVISDGGGEEVVISWDLRTFTPLAGDRVLVSCGPRASFDDCMEKGGELMVNTSSALVAGSVRSVALINMRCNYSFTYVRAPPSRPAAVGVVLAEATVPLAPGLATMPTQGQSSTHNDI